MTRHTQYVVRPMMETDIDAVCRMEAENFSTPWTRQGFLEGISQNNTLFWVIEENQTLLGYCGAYLVCGEAEITNVSVGKKRQGEGIGSVLLACFLQELEKRKIEQVTLEVRKSNVGAIHLYEKHGFLIEGIRPNFYEKPTEDACIMWKR